MKIKKIFPFIVVVCLTFPGCVALRQEPGEARKNIQSAPAEKIVLSEKWLKSDEAASHLQLAEFYYLEGHPPFESPAVVMEVLSSITGNSEEFNEWIKYKNSSFLLQNETWISARTEVKANCPVYKFTDDMSQEERYVAYLNSGGKGFISLILKISNDFSGYDCCVRDFIKAVNSF